jgi:hypothetical protein
MPTPERDSRTHALTLDPPSADRPDRRATDRCATPRRAKDRCAKDRRAKDRRATDAALAPNLRSAALLVCAALAGCVAAGRSEPREPSFLDLLASAPGRLVTAELGELEDDGAAVADEQEGEVGRELAVPVAGEFATLDDGDAPLPPPAKPLAPQRPALHGGQNPYIEFGPRIVVHDNGLIVKPYPLPLGKAEKILQFMQLYAPFPIEKVDPANPPKQAASVDSVLAEVLPNWEVGYFHDLRKEGPAPAAQKPIADWLVITTGSELLYEVEAFINLFLAEVPQVEIEAKIVEVTEMEELDLGVRGAGSGPVLQFPDGKLVDSFDYDFPNVGADASGLLTLGGVQDGVTYGLLIQAAELSSNVEISSMPKIAVREGERAEILNTQELPTYTISSINQDGNYSAALVYKEVGVKLFIVPAIIGTDTVALYIDIEASQQVGEQSFFVSTGLSGTTELQAPVLANRKAKTVVYLRPGEGVILGGLTTERTVKQVRGVPILGRIPLLGLLFRSKFDRTERTSVLFFIRPRILQGIDLQRPF